MKTDDSIELRSEKVRNIIGQIPPRIIRIGTSIIFILISGILIFCYFYQYDYIVEASSVLTNKNDSLLLRLNVPTDKNSLISFGNKVELTLVEINPTESLKLYTQIESKPEIIELNKKKAYYSYFINISDSSLTSQTETELEIKDSLKVNAKIYTGKQSVFQRLFK